MNGVKNLKNNTVITIGRQFGSGGSEIGRLVAEQLGIPFYDKELINHIAKESGLCREIIEDYDEKPTNSFLYSLSLGAYNYSGGISDIFHMPISDRIFIIHSDVIRDLASKGPCVIVGRCAESILKDVVPTVNVFVYNDLSSRITRVSEHDNISREKAADIIKKTDKKRAAYHNSYSEQKWGAAETYDLCIRSNIGTENAAKIIVDYASMK